MNHPELNVMVNSSDVPMAFLIKVSISGKKVILTPGEGKIPSNIRREIDFDVKACPLKHPSGKFGVHFKRLIKLSYKKYFRARLFHHSGLFANDNDY